MRNNFLLSGLQTYIRCNTRKRIISQLFNTVLRTSPLTWLALDVGAAETSENRYNLQFLQGNQTRQDSPETLRAFLDGDNMPPGNYSVDLYINRNRAPRQMITFERSPNSGAVEPCISLEQFKRWGLDTSQLEHQGITLPDAEQCPDWSTLIEHFDAQYDANRQELHISFPQALMTLGARGYVDPQLWDAGIQAGFLDYSMSARTGETYGMSSQYANAGLRSGFNLGQWRLRNESNYNLSTASKSAFQNNRSYAQRDITSLKSQLTLGTTYTSSQIFDSVRFKGVQLQSDEAMLPDSMRGYAPVVRGIAQSNATVEIRQNNFLIYSQNVSPGAFVISEFYPSGSNGDLEVTVIETDGQKTVFTQPFTSLPQMVRREQVRYSLAAGQYDDIQGRQREPKFALAGITYGLTDDISMFGGSLIAEGFYAKNLGITQNTSYGAFSTNVTHSNSRSDAGINTGQSIQFNYAKNLMSTDTTFSLAGYRFSTEGYRTLSEQVADQKTPATDTPIYRPRTRMDVTVYQSLGNRKYGMIYLSASEQRYWNQPGTSQQFNAGYSHAWRSINYSANVTYSQYPQPSRYSNPTQLLFTASMPIGASATTRSYSSVMAQSGGRYNVQSSISGPIPGMRDSNYNAQLAYDNQNKTSSTLGITSITPVAHVDASYSQGQNSYTAHAGANGSIVVHGGGINLGQPLSESFALAHVPGAKAGSRIANYPNVTVGANGYAVVPSTSPYRHNWINLNTEDLDADIEVENSLQQIVPRRGSVTHVSYVTVTGRRVQMELVDSHGKPLPFGASVTDESGKQLAVVDQSGVALIMAEKETGAVTVNNTKTTCLGNYALPPKTPDVHYEHIRVVCHYPETRHIQPPVEYAYTLNN